MKEDTIYENKFIQIICCARIINLMVNEGLKEVDKLIMNVCNIVKCVKAFPQRLDNFKSIVN